jgi:hypothetical protein
MIHVQQLHEWLDCTGSNDLSLSHTRLFMVHRQICKSRRCLRPSFREASLGEHLHQQRDAARGEDCAMILVAALAHDGEDGGRVGLCLHAGGGEKSNEPRNAALGRDAFHVLFRV